MEAHEIAHHLIYGAQELKKQYPKQEIYVSELLPRLECAQRETREINNLLSANKPTNIHLINHQNLTSRHMHDDKHVSRNYIHLVVENIFNEIDEVAKSKSSKTKPAEPRYDGRHLQQRGQNSSNNNRNNFSNRNDNKNNYNNSNNHNNTNREDQNLRNDTRRWSDDSTHSPRNVYPAKTPRSEHPRDERERWDRDRMSSVNARIMGEMMAKVMAQMNMDKY